MLYWKFKSVKVCLKLIKSFLGEMLEMFNIILMIFSIFTTVSIHVLVNIFLNLLSVGIQRETSGVGLYEGL